MLVGVIDGDAIESVVFVFPIDLEKNKTLLSDLEFTVNGEAAHADQPVGVILPSEKSFDRLIVTMVRRAWAPFLLLFAGVVALSLVERRRLAFFESYLVAAGYGLFFVLLAYLGAFMNFYLAWVLSLAIGGGLLLAYLRLLLPKQRWPRVVTLLTATMLTPTAAVMLEGYTGLIYTLEITVLVAGLMYVSTREAFRMQIAAIGSLVPENGGAHA